MKRLRESLLRIMDQFRTRRILVGGDFISDEFLYGRIARVSREAPLLVCLHHPPVPVGSAWLDGVGLLNGTEFLDVIDRHTNVRCVLAGHVHQAFDVQRGSVRMLASPTTCAHVHPAD